MTAPEPHGYPDWGRFTAGSDKLLDRFTLNNQNNQFQSSAYFVGDIPYIRLFLSIETNNASVSIRWGQDAAFATILWTDVVEFRAGNVLDIDLPTKAPFVQVLITPVANPYNIIFTLTSAHNRGRPLQQGNVGNVIISVVAQNVAGGGGVFEVFADSIRPGPAVWSIQTASTNWVGSLGAMTSGGTNRRIDIASNVAGNPSRLVFLPAAPVRIGVTNNAAAAANFDIFCSVHPDYYGN